MKGLASIILGLATVVGLVYGTLAWQHTQRSDVEKQVAGALLEYRQGSKVQLLLDRLVQAEERAKLWSAYVRNHPHDVKAQEAMRYWEREVEALRQRLMALQQ